MEMKDTLSSCSNSNSKEQQMQQIQNKAKKSCIVSFRQLHSHLKLLSNNDLKGTRTECGFKRAFATLFGQDVKTFTGTMFLNMDQLEKQLDNEEFQEIGSMVAFKVLDTQFQMFIKSQIYLDDEYVILTRNYFLQYTQLEILEFCDTLIQHMESVKKSIDKRVLHKREYASWVNERQMQTIEEKVDTSKALNASLVDTESSGTKSKKHDTNSRSGNDAHADDADIRPIYDEEPMSEVETTAKINVFATGQQHIEQPEFNNEGEVDQNVEQCYETHYKELSDSIKTTRAKTIEHITSLIAQNAEFNAQLQEKGFAIAALKNKLRKLTGNSMNNKFARTIILGKLVLQPHRNQSVVRQPNAFKSERPRISKPRFASQVDVNNDLSKPLNTHYLPKERESAVKCVFNGNHDHCVTKLLNEVNSRAKVPSNKTTNKNKPVEHISFSKKPERKILIGHRFSIKKTSTVHEKTMIPCLRWKQTGRIFKIVGLRWVPSGKIFDSSTTKVDSEPPNGLNEDINNPYECEQTLNVTACTLNLSVETKLQGRFLASFQDDAKYEHVGQDTRSQGDKDDQD
nr:hypothetical protein [Tanacetum cinerariifolium]